MCVGVCVRAARVREREERTDGLTDGGGEREHVCVCVCVCARAHARASTCLCSMCVCARECVHACRPIIM